MLKLSRIYLVGLIAIGCYLGLLLFSTFLRSDDTSDELDLSAFRNMDDTVVIVSGGGATYVVAGKSDDSLRMPVIYRNDSGSVSNLAIQLSEEIRELYPVHLVGEGYGASVASTVAESNPDEILSLSLFHPRGLEEFQPLGLPLLDRSLRSVESMAYWVIDRWIPFSWLSGIRFDSLYWRARVASLSHLKLTREHAVSVRVPISIGWSGEWSDETETFAEMIPQAVVIEFVNMGSFVPFMKSVNGHGLDPVESDRILDESHSSSRQVFEGASLLLAMLLIASSTMISEDLACIGSGILVSQGGIGYTYAVMACFTGIYIGDLAIYFLGRIFGETLLKKPPFCWLLSLSAVEASEKWFHRRGVWVLLMSRFMPGSRVPAYFAAGVLKTKFSSVSLVLATAALIWVPLIVYFSMTLGDQILHFFDRYENWGLVGFLSVIVLVFFVTHRLLPLLTFRGRRIAYSRIQRVLRWEFWPAKLIYPPVIAYILFQSIKHRSFSLYTLVNPMVDCGGLVDESKSDILNRLKDSGAPVAPYVIINPKDGVERMLGSLRQAQNEWGHDRSFPFALKPDHGERGKGVCIVKSQEELLELLPTLEGLHIAQRYVEGIEFGVFYYRFPKSKKGSISSITRKSYTSVVGDGSSDLEHLILCDPRAVLSAEMFLKNHGDSLYEVPQAGEIVKLAEIGTHSRGSLFLDGGDLFTPELMSRMDEICLPVEGFYFGRFDIKVPNDEALRKGEDLQIIELNLLTSEPTHMYDPKYKIKDAWSVLVWHWKVVFEISVQNLQRGFRPLGTRGVFTKIVKHYID